MIGAIVAFFISKVVRKDSETKISTYMITSGIMLIAGAFPGTKEIIIGMFAKLLKIDMKTETDYVMIVCGFVLIGFGYYYERNIRDRIHILNMLGIPVQKEISDENNIKDLKLDDYKVKEFIIDISGIYDNNMDCNSRFSEDMKKSLLQYAIQGKLVEQRSEEGTAEELFEQIQEEKQRLIRDKKIKKEKPLPEITDEEKPFDIPESWKWARFSELCSVLTCGYASTPTYVDKENGKPFISAKNVKPYKFMPEDHNYISNELYEKLTQNAKPEKGDILLTRVGAGIGEAAIIDVEWDFAIYVSLTLIKLVDVKLVDNRYILYWLNSPIGVASAKKNIYGKNASQGNLNHRRVHSPMLAS